MMKTTLLLSIITASGLLISCLHAGKVSAWHLEIASDMMSSALKELERAGYFSDDVIDSVFVLGEHPVVLYDRVDQSSIVRIAPDDFSVDEVCINFAENDHRFRADSLFGKVNLLRYYFIQFDTLYMHADQLVADVIFGSLSSRVRYTFYFDRDAREVVRKEFVSVSNNL